MKTPFKKLRGLGLHKHRKHDPLNTQRSLAQSDELSHASQDMQDMKDCYDSLLSAAAATANSAYEFSESLREMGDCLLEKTSLNDDEDSGRVLLMMGKVQFEIQRLVDNYRSHISRTITVPSESLLNELRIVEEMKRQCDEKRMWYEEMKNRQKENNKRRLGSSKGENVTSNQVRAAQEEFEEEATLFVFRMKSLKGGQSRSLVTQAARHHAAQMCFFRKALKALEAIEPDIKLVAEEQHIDYQFSGLDDDDRDSVFLTDDEDEDDSDDDDDDEVVVHGDGELSFEYQRNYPNIEVCSSHHSMELDSADITFPQVASVKEAEVRKGVWKIGREVNAGSKSAPLSSSGVSNSNSSIAEGLGNRMRQSSVRKLNTYALPTPLKTPTPATASNMWHSSPLEANKKFSVSWVLKESNSNIIKGSPLPPPVGSLHPCVSKSGSAKKIKRYAFSGPIPTATATGYGHVQSSTTKPSSSSSVSFVSSPKISELHELPRPPPSNNRSLALNNVGFSAPLFTPHHPNNNSHIHMLSLSPPRTLPLLSSKS